MSNFWETAWDDAVASASLPPTTDKEMDAAPKGTINTNICPSPLYSYEYKRGEMSKAGQNLSNVRHHLMEQVSAHQQTINKMVTDKEELLKEHELLCALVIESGILSTFSGDTEKIPEGMDYRVAIGRALARHGSKTAAGYAQLAQRVIKIKEQNDAARPPEPMSTDLVIYEKPSAKEPEPLSAHPEFQKPFKFDPNHRALITAGPSGATGDSYDTSDEDDEDDESVDEEFMAIMAKKHNLIIEENGVITTPMVRTIEYTKPDSDEEIERKRLAEEQRKREEEEEIERDEAERKRLKALKKEKANKLKRAGAEREKEEGDEKGVVAKQTTEGDDNKIKEEDFEATTLQAPPKEKIKLPDGAGERIRVWFRMPPPDEEDDDKEEDDKEEDDKEEDNKEKVSKDKDDKEDKEDNEAGDLEAVDDNEETAISTPRSNAGDNIDPHAVCNTSSNTSNDLFENPENHGSILPAQLESAEAATNDADDNKINVSLRHTMSIDSIVVSVDSIIDVRAPTPLPQSIAEPTTRNVEELPARIKQDDIESAKKEESGVTRKPSNGASIVKSGADRVKAIAAKVKDGAGKVKANPSVKIGVANLRNGTARVEARVTRVVSDGKIARGIEGMKRRVGSLMKREKA